MIARRIDDGQQHSLEAVKNRVVPEFVQRRSSRFSEIGHERVVAPFVISPLSIHPQAGGGEKLLILENKDNL